MSIMDLRWGEIPQALMWSLIVVKAEVSPYASVERWHALVVSEVDVVVFDCASQTLDEDV